MKTYAKKLFFVPLLAFAFIALPLFSASASTSDFKPFLKSPKMVLSHAIALRFDTNNNIENRTVAVKIRLRNDNTGNVMFETMMTKVNADGVGMVWANNLMADTKYNVKIRVRKITLSDFSDYSNVRHITTAKAPIIPASNSSSSSTSDTSSSTDNSSSSSQ
jgi:hypothetical protein